MTQPRQPRPNLLDVASLGLIAGMRSMAAPALLGRGARSSLPRTLLALLAAGEVVADKLPGIPARIETGPLLGRALLGGASGAVLGARGGRSVAAAALVGGLAAVVGTYGAYALRRELGRHLPDSLLGVLEDVAVLALAERLRRYEER